MNLSTSEPNTSYPRSPENPLLSIENIENSFEALPEILSPVPATTLHVAAWPNAYSTTPAQEGLLSLPELASHLTEQGRLVCPKAQAEIFGLFKTADGRRTDPSIAYISGVALDCDGTGSWDLLKQVLDRLGIGYILYQSSSYTAAAPKWRCIMVLDRPFEIKQPSDRATWVGLYRYISEMIGAVAGLSGKGFDGSTTNVSRIWYVGPRPLEAAPAREVVWGAGVCLSLEKLLVAVPSATVGTSRAAPGEFKLSLAGLAFELAGNVGRHLGEGKVAVRCPRDSEHSNPIGLGRPDTSTVVFSTSSFGGFKCQHSHSKTDPTLPTIAEPFTLKHALDVLEQQHPGLLLRARGLQEKFNTPDSPLNKAQLNLKEANRAARKADQVAKDYLRAAETDVATLGADVRFQAHRERADRLAAAAVEAEEKVNALVELLKDSVVIFDRNDDLSIATRIIADWGAEFCVFDQGSFYTYMPEVGIWKQRTRQELEHRVTQYQDALVRADNGGLTSVGWNSSRISGVARVLGAAASRPGFFDDKQPTICFKNGVLRLIGNNEELRPEFVAHSPDFRHRYSIGVSYNGPTPAPAWEKFLNEVLDEKDQILLHEFLGACLVEDATRYQRAVMLVGFGRNGKSSLLDVVRQLVPPEGQAALAPALWSRRFQATRLIAKAINICDEVPNARITESDIFKKIVTGGITESEYKGQDLFSFKPTAGHLFAANELPKTSDNSDGFYRRWIIINMEKQIPKDKIDRHIDEKLKADVPGIISKSIAAYLQLRVRGDYAIPASSDEALAEWQADNDHVLRFLRSYCEPGGKDDWKSVEDVHRKYRQVAQQEGVPINDQVTTYALGRALKRAGLKAENKGPAGGRGWLVKYKPLAGIGNVFPRN